MPTVHERRRKSAEQWTHATRQASAPVGTFHFTYRVAKDEHHFQFLCTGGIMLVRLSDQPYESSDPLCEDLTACGIVIGLKRCHAERNFLQHKVDYGSAPASTPLPSFWGEQGIIQSQLRAV